MMVVQVGPVLYRITEDTKDHDNLGECKPIEAYIGIRKDVKNKNAWYRILWHELIHLILDQLHEYDLGEDERFIDYYANEILGFIMRNQDVFYLTNKVKEIEVCALSYKVKMKNYIDDACSEIDYNKRIIKLCKIGCSNEEQKIVEFLRSLIYIAAAHSGTVVNETMVNRFSICLYQVLIENKDLLIDGKVHREFEDVNVDGL